jgi:hypothetical protein
MTDISDFVQQTHNFIAAAKIGRRTIAGLPISTLNRLLQQALGRSAVTG